MAGSVEKTPWYSAGLSFECCQCGRCCAGPGEGYVWVTAEEIAAIAGYLGVSQEQVRQTYVRRVRGRFSLRERSDNHDCLFLAVASNGGRVCSIYPVRPTQCRTWPFWPNNLRSAESWASAAARCPGINRGGHFSFDEIQARRNATES